MEVKRILVLGSTGSGKTTLARKVSKELGIPHLELDALFWDPGWKQVDTEVFRARVADALKQKDSWVIDGNYSKARDLIWSKAQVAVWLDFPFYVILGRLLKRTVSNCKTKKELWPGCRENLWMQLFSRNSIFLWALRYRKKKRYPSAFAGYPHLKVIRITSPSLMPNILSAYFKEFSIM